MADLNTALFEFIRRLARRGAFFDGAGIFFAEYFPYILALAFLIFVVRVSFDWRIRFAIFAETALAAILARGILTEAIRFFYPVPRPFAVLNFTPLISESSSSFPSGHAAIFFAIAAALFFWNRKWGIWFFVFALVNGIARIFVGVHWPLDIVGGVFVGIGSAFIVHGLTRRHLGVFHS